jgi:large subunit ribosomal protein L10
MRMPMTRQAKEEMVQDLAQKMAEAKGGLVADYAGLNVAAVTEIRRALREVGAEYKVVKNRLMKRAISGTGREGLGGLFTYTTAVLLKFDDELGKLGKVAQDMAKKYEKFQVKGGFVEDDLLTDAKALDTLASLPTLDEARAQLLGLLNTPAAKLLAQINAPASHVVGVIQAKKDKDEGK